MGQVSRQLPEVSGALCSVSGAGPEAAAPARRTRKRAPYGGPGEDRHLTRVTAQYAPGCWWGVQPHRLPRGERKVLGSESANPR